MSNTFSDEIYIAAADSADCDKSKAQYICTGTDDQYIIQAAVDTVAEKKCGEIRGVRIVLLPGNYYIDAFPRKNENGSVAVMLGTATNRFTHIAVLLCGSEHTESTVVHVTENCYRNLDGTESYSVFGCANHNWNHHVFKDLYVAVPGDRKNIVCFG